MQSARQQQAYAVVTGGNRGIGLEVCHKLVARGKPVILTARSLDSARSAAEQLRSSARAGVDVQPLALEQADPASIQAFVQTLQQYDQRIDLLVNNAAILVRHAWDEATYKETLAVDVAAPLLITEQLAPLMPHGSLVIMVSSGNGQSPCLTPDYLAAVRRIDSLQQLHDLAAAVPFVQSSPMGSQPADKPGAMAPTYSVAKALMNRMTQLMAAEGSHLAQRGVSVVAASPGWCRTDMGTDKAERSAAEGADSVLWPWLNWQPQLNGGFTRDGVTLEW